MDPAPVEAWDKVDSVSDDEAFDRLYRLHYHAILAYCRRRTNATEAQDAAAEVFLVAWRRMDDRPDDDQIRAWLYGIAYRVIGHQWRGQHRRRRLHLRLVGVAQPAQPAAEAVAVGRSEDRRVLDAAARLRPSDQEILRLAGWEQLPHRKIAVVLGISPAAVDQRFHRAKKRLAREYDRLATSNNSTGPGEGVQ
jgi:RNA polymerase sigma-70 factor (ECF subfamily)